MDTFRKDSVLAPFEKLTRKMSSCDALASGVIPAVTVLQRLLTKETDEDQGIKTIKGTLAEAVKKRFNDMEKNPLYCIATVLDPRYKDRFFSNINPTEAKEMVMQELQKVSERKAGASGVTTCQKAMQDPGQQHSGHRV